MKKQRFTITAALPYANGPLHIGHIAGAYLPSDIFVRYQKLHGHDVAFICGSDEHGAAITLRAKLEGITPREIIDKYNQLNQKAFSDFGIDFNIFHRTSLPLHYETAQDFFLQLERNGEFTVERTEQYFDEQFQQFLADRYIQGTCPKCQNPNAYGDQCEKCGSALSPTELIEPRSILSGSKPVLKETQHWFLPMNRHQEWVQEWVEKGSFTGMQPPIVAHNPDAWKSNVKGQCISWLKDGLKPRAMTRDLDWGVPVPLEHAKGKVLYVWLDAPIGYISATKEWAREQGKNWEDYWKNSATRLIHFIGKDNIVFHCIIFPILLKAHGGFILPENIPANEFLNLEGDKISTSRNHAVWLHEYLEDFPGKRDELRYVLTSIAPETGDSEFTWKDYQTRINSELVAILGNFVNRVMVLYHKYFEGTLPSDKNLDIREKETKERIGNTYDALVSSIENYKFRQGLQEIMDLARYGNKYLQDNEPWKIFAENPVKTREVLNESLMITAHLAACLQPYLPDTSARIFGMLNLPKIRYQWDEEIIFPAGHVLHPAELLFTKIEDDAIQQQLNKLEEAKKKNAAQKSQTDPIKDAITIEDFTKIDLRVATIKHAQKVPKADKLLQLTLEVGTDERTVLSGIAEHYSPETIIGKQVIVVANLAPRTMRGIESHGMILMAKDADGKLIFVHPEEKTANGSGVS